MVVVVVAAAVMAPDIRTAVVVAVVRVETAVPRYVVIQRHSIRATSQHTRLGRRPHMSILFQHSKRSGPNGTVIPFSARS